MNKLEEIFSKEWYKELSEFLHSENFRYVGRTLLELTKQNVEIAPTFKDTFRAFKECTWNNLHTVILGLDPYPGRLPSGNYVADGLAFSSKYSEKCPKSLNYLFNAIEESIYNKGGYYPENYDLARWANQGVLLLNSALSFPIKEKSGAHLLLWQGFISFVLKKINDRKENISFILMGKDAGKFEYLLTNETFDVLKCEHPSAANYHGGKWNYNNVFEKVKDFQKSKNNIKIIW